ncbi:MAG: hypothetical protein BWY57_01622 [Betaproteobacteria bacterium ADurb.Bin341]|nr:MAG: hypothetical protein BWY57_01622 [Betaproteobacteria bacterium ADurb.Bin341]
MNTQTTPRLEAQITPLLTLIAQKYLDIETLEARKSDRLDFHEVAVWSLHDALEAAFKAGVEVGLATPKVTGQEIASAD